MLSGKSVCHNCSHPLLKPRPVPEPGSQPRIPLPGDAILCGHCGALGYLEDSGYTVRPSEADIKYWKISQPESWRVLRKIQAEIMNR